MSVARTEVKDVDNVDRLIASGDALIKVIMSFQGNDKDWLFLLSQLAYPHLYRPINRFVKPTSNRKRIFHYGKRVWVDRELDEKNEPRGRFKSTLYTKKTSMTLLPEHAKIATFRERKAADEKTKNEHRVGVLFNRFDCRLSGNSDRAYIYTSNGYTDTRNYIEGQGGDLCLNRATTIQKLRDINHAYASRGIPVPDHNEILTRLSQKGMRAVFAREDNLSNRLNAIHKKFLVTDWLNKDVPIYVITPEKGRRNYTFDEQVQDIQEAFEQYEENSAPYFFAKEALLSYNIYHSGRKAEFLNQELAYLDEFARLPNEFKIFNCKDINLEFVKNAFAEDASYCMSFNNLYVLIRWSVRTNPDKKHEITRYLCRTMLDCMEKNKNELVKYAVDHKHFDVCQFLMTNFGREFGDLSNEFCSAVLFNKIEVADSFLEYKINTNVCANETTLKNNTVLQVLLRCYQIPSIAFVKKLVQRGADPFYLNPDKKSALDIAFENDQQAVINYLVDDEKLFSSYKPKQLMSLIATLHRNGKDKKVCEKLSQIYSGDVNKAIEFIKLLRSEAPKLISWENMPYSSVLELSIDSKDRHLILEFIINDALLLWNFKAEDLGRIVYKLIKNNLFEYAAKLLDIRSDIFGNLICSENNDQDAIYFIAKQEMHPRIYQAVCNRNIFINVPDKNKETPIVIAAKRNNDVFVNCLLSDNRISSQYSYDELCKIAVLFIKHKKQYYLQVMMVNKPEIFLHYVSTERKVPLWIIQPLCDLLLNGLDHSMCVNFENQDHENILTLAAKNNHINVVEYIIRNGELLSKFTLKQVNQAMQYLVNNNKIDLARELIKNRPDILKYLLESEQEPSSDLVDSLFRNNPIFLEEDKAGESFLSMAVRNNNRDNLVKRLLENKEMIEGLNKAHLAKILHYLVSNQKYDLAKMLMEIKKDICCDDYIDPNNRTALHVLSTYALSPPELFIAIMNQSRMVNREDPQGETCLTLMINYHWDLLLKFFKEPKFWEKFTTDQISKTFVYAMNKDFCLGTCYPILKYRKDLLVDPSTKEFYVEDNMGETILSRSANKKYIRILDYLLRPEIISQYNEAHLGKVLFYLIRNQLFDEAKKLLSLTPNASLFSKDYFLNQFFPYILTADNPSLEIITLFLQRTENLRPNSVDAFSFWIEKSKGLDDEAILKLFYKFLPVLDVDVVRTVINKLTLSIDKLDLNFLVTISTKMSSPEMIGVIQAILERGKSLNEIDNFMDNLHKVSKHIPCLKPAIGLLRHSEWKGRRVSHTWMDVVKIADAIKADRFKPVQQLILDKPAVGEVKISMGA